ncbi:hypothetical protein LOC67_25080 [Stieleria sp. JC731]|uniref:hypothetical protein n=1 Tax=Pirellulaceae TaxID=2691357 RepID=UPI001E5C5652|nr:hypothetical protein [Stieleria sp. JC731]MCC9603838.1 hypothetical protein [Stieleria sp. JC731]
MKLQIRKYIVASVALAAGMLVTATATKANADESFIVKAEIVSDTVAAPVAPTGYVGDIEYEGEISYEGDIIDGSSIAGCQPRKYDRPDLFYNFYTQGQCNNANAQMYVSPLPTPQFVGHTYFTYQPFYPHEMLYTHKDRYHNHYDNGRGLNRTRVKYSTPPVRTAIENVYWNKLRLPR